jgi:putative endonuclease
MQTMPQLWGMVPRDASIAVYMMASKPYGTLYIGVTSLFEARIVQHREKLIKGFTQKY